MPQTGSSRPPHPFTRWAGACLLGATELGGTAISAAVERSAWSPARSRRAFGPVLQADGSDPLRQAQIKGASRRRSLETVNKVCARASSSGC